MQIPPRDVAASLILRAITRAAWVAAGVLIVATGVMVFDVCAAVGRLSAAGAAIGFLAMQLAALALMYLRPWPRAGVFFLAVSLITIVGYQYVLLTAGLGLGDQLQYLLNRPVVAIVAICAITVNAVHGILWSTAAFVLGEAASIALQLALGGPLLIGVGPAMAYALVVVILLWIMFNTRNQLRRNPDLGMVDAETRRLEDEYDAHARAAAVIHDTVLSDLAAIVHGRVVLMDWERQHLRAHVKRLRSAMEGTDETVETGQLDVELLHLVTELQWRGLSVEVSGSGRLTSLSRQSRAVVLDAIRASLENVLVHAGTASADLFLDDSAGELMIMIADEGKGFDPGGVGSDRLGLRLSIMKRIQDCGGSASIWSQPGVGTSIVLSLPLAEEVASG
jgi:signal transduction histidine kinase